MIPIQFVTGDATRPIGGGHKIIAHVCNNQGQWGAGFSGALSRRWKEPEARYRAWHAAGEDGQAEFRLGEIQLVVVKSPEPLPLIIANMIAQNGIRKDPQDKTCYLSYPHLIRCLARIAAIMDRGPGISLHIPRIGAGRAGGDWSKIQTWIEAIFSDLDIPVFVYTLKGE